MFKIGLSSKSNVLSDELFRTFAEAGVSTVEMSNCSAGYEAIDFASVKSLADKHGITLWSMHLPFREHNGIPHDMAHPELCERSVEDYKKLIKKGVEIGVDKFVLHPSNDNVPEGERRQWIEVCKRNIAELVEFAAENGAVIALENMTHGCLGNTIDEFSELVNSHPMTRVCFDTNHLLYESPSEFIKRFGDRIVTLHVSDCNLEVEQHLFPGEGKIDFGAILTALHEVGYSGPWLYEVSYKCPLPENHKNRLTPKSFVINAEELFAGKAPTKQR